MTISSLRGGDNNSIGSGGRSLQWSRAAPAEERAVVVAVG